MNAAQKELLDFIKDNLATFKKEDFIYEDEDILYEVQQKIGASSYNSGASKAVFYFDDYPQYVIKIPFIGYNEAEFFNELPHKDMLINEWDYCELEENIYQKAIEFGVDSLLAATVFLDYVNDIPVYCSLRCQKLHSMSIDDMDAKSEKSAIKIMNSYGVLCKTSIICQMIQEHGEAKVKKLFEFLQLWDVDDFHSQNFMTAPDGTVRMVDYSGYFGD